MSTAHEIDPRPTEERGSSELEEPQGPVSPLPSLAELRPEAASRIVHFIVTSTLQRGLAPTAVIALYTDLSGDEQAVRYADRRFILKQMPPDWREVESRTLELEESARLRGLDLAAAWRRATSVAMRGEDALEQLARLAGVPAARSGRTPQRSMFDDPEDLDELQDDADYELDLRARLEDHAPDLVDLTDASQRRIRRFAIEERLEHGLPAVELLELYRSLEHEDDRRAQQYLDRVFVDHAPPGDWLDLQDEAARVVDVAETRGRDAGHLYADLLRSSPGMEPLAALHLLFERLLS
jgi:hypothetical protein